MITIHKGDLLSVDKGFIVHGCNAQGVMRSGVAKQIREKYPKVYKKYIQEHARKPLKVGDIIPVQVTDDLVIINAITQKYYGREENHRYVSYDGLDLAFQRINSYIGKGELHFPLIGAGLAQGNWYVIEEIITDKINYKNINLHQWEL